MFGLLNPALTPLKAKVALVAAGVVVALLLASCAASGILFKMYQGAQVAIGSLTVQLESTEQLNRDNETSWGIERGNLNQRIADKETLRAKSEQAAADAHAREVRYDRQLAAALKKLKESTDANEEAREWAVVPVPDAVIHGMCAAAKEAVGEAASCTDHEDGIDRNPVVPSRSVPGPTAT